MALTSAGTTNGAEDVLLCKADAIMDGSIQPHIDNFISVALRDCGWDPARPDIPPSVIYPIEVEAISMLLRNYSGLAHICENVAEWCADITFLTQELRGEPPPDEVTKGDAAENLITEALCLIFSKDFDPEPYRHLLASQEGSSWSPPPYYWTLLQSEKVVETIKRVYDRHRGSEFLNAFLQDYCESHIDASGAIAKKQLTDITAHFAIFTKTFRELLVDFLVEDDLYEFGDRDPHNISKLLCHAENAYLYAQALLHFLPNASGDFAPCRRLAQLIFRTLRENRKEFAVANRLLLFTALPNYPDLCQLFEPVQQSDVSGRMHMTRQNIVEISDALARIIRNFERHKTLLMVHEVSAPIPRIADEEGEIEPLDSNIPSSWETEMLCEIKLREPMNTISSHNDDSSSSILSTREIFQNIDWPVSAELKSKTRLPVVWKMPSASQVGDEDIILEEAQEESDRRGTSKLVLPPMEALRETFLLDQLWEYLVCPGLPGQPTDMPVGKLIELILMLATYSDYELTVSHLQRDAPNKEEEETEEDEGDEEEEVTFEDELNSQQEDENYDQECCDFSTSSAFLTEQVHFAPQPPSPYENHRGVKRNSIPEILPPPAEQNQNGEASIRKKPRIAASIVSSYMARSMVPSMLGSYVYLDRHAGSRLRALRPDRPELRDKLTSMFDSCHALSDRYKNKARKELFTLYDLSRTILSKSEPLPDAYLAKLSLCCNSSAGATAVLRLIEDRVLPSQEDDHLDFNPLHKFTPALQSLLLRISLWHPRKRVVVAALFKQVLERSFRGPFVADEQTQSLRRRIVSVAMAPLGLEDSIETRNRDPHLPWNAAEAEWQSAIIPGYKVVFSFIRELLECFDLNILRETLEFVLGVCGAPMSPVFAESLLDLLRNVILQAKYDFSSPLNATLRSRIRAFTEDIYSVWAPDSPSMRVLRKLQFVAEGIGLMPEHLPLKYGGSEEQTIRTEGESEKSDYGSGSLPESHENSEFSEEDWEIGEVSDD